MLPVAVARSSSGSIAIRYVLPVLQMTLCFHTMEPIGRIVEDLMFRRNLPGGATTTDGRQTTAMCSSVRQNVAIRRTLLSTIDLVLL